MHDIERFIEAHRAEVVDLVSLGAASPDPCRPSGVTTTAEAVEAMLMADMTPEEAAMQAAARPRE